jgi:DNA-binding transcriptional MerR regulator
LRIAELSRRSGASIPTIKYYLREGLLAPGEATAPNQADYDERHLSRLELINALREGAGLSVATLRRVFDIMENPAPRDRPTYLSTAVSALSDPLEVPHDQTDAYAAADDDVDRLLSDLGWDTDPSSPGRDDLVRALVNLHRYLPSVIDEPGQLRPFAEAVRGLAEVEIPDTYDPETEREAALRYSVLGTVLFEPVILALRRLAHVDRVRELSKRKPPNGSRKRGRRSPS